MAQPPSRWAKATPTTPTISNIPAGPVVSGSFTATLSTNSDGAPSVTSSTPGVCTVGVDNLTVSFVGVGTCTLTPHVAASTDYVARNGVADSFGVGKATPTPPTISNIPANPVFGGSFTANVVTNSDGAASVTSSTPASARSRAT